MTTRFNGTNTSEPGIIILGNAGAGKSYLCNLLIGHDQFEAAFRPQAVTKQTEYHRILIGSNYVRIYDIPGLVEANQAKIDQNKREIMKAFQECPVAVVIFVWAQVGGRAQQDDIIAFKALNDAYQFPADSLMFVVNNIPQRRPSEYEGQFIATLSNMLKPISIWMNDVIFVDNMQDDEMEKKTETRSKLFLLISQHHTSLQKKQGGIILQSDQLEEMRKLLKKQRLEAEKDREVFQNQIQNMAADYKASKEKNVWQYRQMEIKLENTVAKAKKDRERNELECAVIQDDLQDLKIKEEAGTKNLRRKLEDVQQRSKQERQRNKLERDRMQMEFAAWERDTELEQNYLRRKIGNETRRAERGGQQNFFERAETEAELADDLDIGLLLFSNLLETCMTTNTQQNIVRPDPLQLQHTRTPLFHTFTETEEEREIKIKYLNLSCFYRLLSLLALIIKNPFNALFIIVVVWLTGFLFLFGYVLRETFLIFVRCFRNISIVIHINVHLLGKKGETKAILFTFIGILMGWKLSLLFLRFYSQWVPAYVIATFATRIGIFITLIFRYLMSFRQPS
ncbi:hypothetical protein I4U23_016950 [Adineta vaga]|nr:hypothetical protein I4U23_016950 [Adineta vaga]